MSRLKLLLLGYCFLFLKIGYGSAQNLDSIKVKISSIAKELKVNDSVNFSSDLFLHLDKNVYLSNEKIWFAAYLLNYTNEDKSHTLHFALINDMSQKIEFSSNYVLENGIASGSFLIPETIQTGNYSIFAYTNNYPIGKDRCIWRQSIRVFGAINLPFRLTFTELIEKDSIFITGKIIDENKIPVNAKINYKIYADGILIKEVQDKTNVLGQIMVSVPKPLDINTIEILGEIRSNKKSMNFRLPVKGSAKLSQILFYPVGDKLLSNQIAKVYFELKNLSGAAISEKLTLFKNNVGISSFCSDIYGRGSFSFLPEAGQYYSVKINRDSILPIQKFPQIKDKVRESVQCDTEIINELKLQLSFLSPGKGCFVIVHNQKTVLYASHVKLIQPQGTLKISAQDWSKGLATVCIYSDDKELLWKKNIFIRDICPTVATITTDSSNYNRLSKVILTIKLQNEEGVPVKGFFSCGVTATKVLCQNDLYIDKLYSYSRFLCDDKLFPSYDNFKNYKNRTSNLDIILDDFPKEKMSEIILKHDLYDGYVLYGDKILQKSVNLLLIGEEASSFSTNTNGRFVLPYGSIRGKADSKILLSIKNPTPSHQIILEDPYKYTDDQLAKYYIMSSNFMKDEFSAEEKESINSLDGNALKEVVITKKNNGQKDFFGKINSSGICNDYVCRLGFLNCKGHSRSDNGSQQAIDGRSYLIYNGLSQETVVYHCEFNGLPPYIKTINAVVYPENPVPFDIKNNSVTEDLLRTTLYWESFITTDDQGEAKLIFYTNNRLGQFSGVIQGLTNNGMFTGEFNFNVVE